MEKKAREGSQLEAGFIQDQRKALQIIRILGKAELSDRTRILAQVNSALDRDWIRTHALEPGPGNGVDPTPGTEASPIRS